MMPDDHRAPKRPRLASGAWSEPDFKVPKKTAQAYKVSKVPELNIPEEFTTARSTQPEPSSSKRPKPGRSTKPLSGKRQHAPSKPHSKPLISGPPTFILSQKEPEECRPEANRPTFIVPQRCLDEPKSSSFSVLRPPRLPELIASSHTPLPMHPLPAPDFFTEVERDTSSLRRLPPPLPLPAPQDHIVDKSMRTISTTGIALATDLSSDSGTAELAHIFLHDQHPEIVNHQDKDPFTGHIGLSPQKGMKYIKGKGKGKETRFTRWVSSQNGLARFASDVKQQTHIDLTLWHKEFEKALSSPSSHLTPDLRLRIIKILDLPAGAKPSSPRKPTASSVVTDASLSPGLAICRIISLPGTHNFKLISLKSIQEGNHFVLFSFPRLAPPRGRGELTRVYPRNPEGFVVGREVHVWEPWHEISLPSKTGLAQLTGKREPAPFPVFPSTFSRTQQREADMRPTGDVALLCLRFVIMPLTDPDK